VPGVPGVGTPVGREGCLRWQEVTIAGHRRASDVPINLNVSLL
jgi:hypothetical protein